MPKFELVRRELEERIRRGEYDHGEALPPEMELASFFAVGRNTIRKALKVLRDNGLVSTQQGHVSWVNRPAEEYTFAPASRLAWFSCNNITTANHNIIYFEIFKAVVKTAAKYGLQVDFYPLDSLYALLGWANFSENINRYIGVFACGINTVKLSPGLCDRLQELPNLIAIDDSSNVPGRHLVSIDNYAGGRLAAEHLLQCNCRKLCMMLPLLALKPFEDRRRGFEDAVRKFGTAAQCTIIRHSQKSSNDYFDIAEEHWQTISQHDAVFCYCDDLANGIMLAARYHHSPIPEKFSLVGFDGMDIVRHIQPPLTTIRQPVQAVADAAVKLALELHETPDIAPQKILLDGKLLSGATTRIVRNSERRFKKI